MKPKVAILSLGCPRNIVDSENILGRLCRKGYSVVDMDKAQVAIVNTCGFIEQAKRESIDAILDLVELKKEGKLKKILVYGCLTQRYRDELKRELPEVDAFIGKVSLNHSLERFPITPRHYAYLKICEGCVNNCSYCIIPRIKGRFISLDTDSVLKRAQSFNRQRISELNIVGQDITGYGIDLCGKFALSALLKKVLKVTGKIGWIRLLYLNPCRIDNALLKLVRDEPRICKYMDIPVQHINERILKAMNRKTAKKDILKTIGKVRKNIPGVALRTSVIVGFPSETDKEFKELLSFIEETKFERLGAFIYSREEGTPAYHLKGQIPQKVKEERFNQVMQLQQEISRELNARLLGKTLRVMVEEKEEGAYFGRSEYDAPEVDGMVYINSRQNFSPGDFVRVRVTDTLEYDLVGEVTS
ncbi:MAG: MiaB/RimO family radical SAM methylthiotransferase [Candidatus Omnitrophica bacterium]|nr:MiaB/RimO family radical SAM methylthiotransferase [Candidatus Omnitrophota bacterium]